MYLKMSHFEVYALPVQYRKWYIERLKKYYDNKYKKEETDPKPINKQNKLMAIVNTNFQ